jgi:hypothetical protein
MGLLTGSLRQFAHAPERIMACGILRHIGFSLNDAISKVGPDQASTRLSPESRLVHRLVEAPEGTCTRRKPSPEAAQFKICGVLAEGAVNRLAILGELIVRGEEEGFEEGHRKLTWPTGRPEGHDHV